MFRSVQMYWRNFGLGGFLAAVKAKITGSTVLFQFKRADCRFPMWLRIPSSDTPTYEQVFINREYEFSVQQDPKIIVDAGANIGLASIYFANQYPQAKIISIEPEESNFTLLKKNTAPYSNIVPVQAALWHRNEEINLVDPDLGNWGFMTRTKDSAETLSAVTRHAVKGMTVDEIMRNHHLERIDILKVDIEGAEREVFGDTSAWIEKVDSIIAELHERMKPGCNRSFYCGTDGFDNEWQQGENVYLSRGDYLRKQPH